MKTNRQAAVLALGLALLSPLAGAQQVVDSEWWKVDFESPTPKSQYLEDGSLNVLTNDEGKAGGGTIQPYYTGVWAAEDGDESYVTNEYCPSAKGGTNYCIKLDTQGNDFTWAPTNVEKAIQGVITLVDADLYLVGSDTAPDPSDFDQDGDVQTAIFLKNEVDEDSGETTNSILCVYFYDGTPGVKKNVWQELEGRRATETNDIPDNAWYRVQVLVDYQSDPDTPKVEVYVDGIKLHARGDDSTTRFTASHYDVAAETKCVQSVSFRGTGAIDNFVGKTRKETFPESKFKAVFYTNDVEVAEMAMTTDGKVKIGKELASFSDSFKYDNYKNKQNPATYAMSRIEVTNFLTGSVTTYRYGYDKTDGDNPLIVLDPDPEHIDVVTETEEEDGEEFSYQTGFVYIKNLPTTGATLGDDPEEPIVIARIYFEDLPQPGDFKLTASQNAGANPADQKFNANDANLPVSTTFTFPEMIVEGTTTNVLRKVAVTNAFDVSGAFADHTFTVTVPVAANAAAFSDKTIPVAAATYAEGDYTGKAITAVATGNGVYEVGAWVAKIGETNLYESLRAAIEDAEAGDTIVMIADDRVSFSAEATEIGITKALTIDGGSNTLYGVSAYAYDGRNDHDIYVGGSGDVTIKDLRITEFSDTAPYVQSRTYPIWTGQAYSGKLTLDGVTIDKFARGAINLNGGRFEITNCVITGCDGSATAPEKYFQNAITVFKAKGTVADSTFSGIGSDTNNQWGAGLVTFNSNGDGEVTFLSGSYTADYLIEVASNATGKAVFEGGTFIATGEEASAFQLDEGEDATFYVDVTGGWFDRKPEAAVTVVRAPLVAKEAAPGTATPWTVGQTFAITFWTGDELDGEPAFWATNAFTGETGYGPTNDPAKAETAGATFTFEGWTNAVAGGAAVATADLPAAEADATWTAVWTEVAKTFDITFVAEGAEPYVTNVTYNATGYAPADPTKASTPEFDYVFQWWTNAVGDACTAALLPAATADETWYAEFEATRRKYWISWVVDETTTSNEVEYGQVPAYAGTPTKASTETTDYEFAGWDSEPVEVAGEATYTATWTEKARPYEIKFWAGTEGEGDDPFFATNAPYGSAGYGPTNAPTKEATAQFTYDFAGWTNAAAGGATVATDALPPVSGAAEWTAVFSETTNAYDVIWVVEGSDPETNSVAYGATPVYPNGTPERASTVATNFTFAGWTPEVAAVTGDATYTATWTETLRKYWISWVVDGTTTSNEVDYGAVPSYGADPEKADCVFKGWATAEGATEADYVAGAALPEVGGEATYYAVFESAKIDPIDPGDGMDPQEKVENPPVEVTEDPVTGDVSFEVRFRGVEGITYQLLAAGSLDVTESQWENPDNTTVKVIATVVVTGENAGQIQTLKFDIGPDAPDIQFFKIGAIRTPAGD